MKIQASVSYDTDDIDHLLLLQPPEAGSSHSIVPKFRVEVREGTHSVVQEDQEKSEIVYVAYRDPSYDYSTEEIKAELTSNVGRILKANVHIAGYKAAIEGRAAKALLPISQRHREQLASVGMNPIILPPTNPNPNPVIFGRRTTSHVDIGHVIKVIEVLTSIQGCLRILKSKFTPDMDREIRALYMTDEAVDVVRVIHNRSEVCTVRCYAPPVNTLSGEPHYIAITDNHLLPSVRNSLGEIHVFLETDYAGNGLRMNARDAKCLWDLYGYALFVGPPIKLEKAANG